MATLTSIFNKSNLAKLGTNTSPLSGRHTTGPDISIFKISSFAKQHGVSHAGFPEVSIGNRISLVSLTRPELSNRPGFGG